MDGINLPYPPPPDAFQNMNGISSGYAMPVNIAQLQPDPNQGIIRDTFNAFIKKRQEQEQQGGLLQSILSGRFAMPDSTPNLQDVSRSITQTQQAFNAPDLFKAARPEEIAQQRVMSDLSPVTNQLGLMNQASSVVKNIRDSKNAGGATGELIDRMMTENPGMSFRDALYQVQTGMRQGLQIDAQGNIVPMAGLPSAKFTISNAEQSGKEKAQLDYASPIAAAGAYGREIGGKQAALNEDVSTLPQLEATVEQLNQLGKTATYTRAGQLKNDAMRQLGMSMPQGAVDRAAYASLVDNQILPLLRRTFGAQFTEREGATLRATLGDVNKSPEEKSAILRSFIDQKKQTIGSLQRETGVSGVQTMGGQQPQAADPLGIR